MIEGLKKKWKIKSNFQALIIIFVFSITGSIAVYLAKPTLLFLGINKEFINPWFYYPIRILIIFPIYQLIILFIGSIFGQFSFFWNMQKKMLRKFKIKK